MIAVIQAGRYGNTDQNIFRARLYYCDICGAILMANDNELLAIDADAKFADVRDPYPQIMLHCPECDASTYVTSQCVPELRERLSKELWARKAL